MGLLRDTYIYVKSNSEAIYAQNGKISEQNDILKKNHQEEMEVKNRVDISLKEYEELKKERDILKSKNEEYNRFIKELSGNWKLPIDILQFCKTKSVEVVNRAETLKQEIYIVLETDYMRLQ